MDWHQIVERGLSSFYPLPDDAGPTGDWGTPSSACLPSSKAMNSVSLCFMDEDRIRISLFQNAVCFEELDGALHRHVIVSVAIRLPKERAVEKAVVLAFEGHKHALVSRVLHELGESLGIFKRHRSICGANGVNFEVL